MGVDDGALGLAVRGEFADFPVAAVGRELTVGLLDDAANCSSVPVVKDLGAEAGLARRWVCGIFRPIAAKLISRSNSAHRPCDSGIRRSCLVHAASLPAASSLAAARWASRILLPNVLR